MNLGNNLLELRKKRSLTQTDAAKGLGVSLRAYQNYERGEREPQAAVLVAAADFYGITLDELVGRTPPEPVEKRGNEHEKTAGNPGL